jgi:hypothetical protein
MRDARSTLAGGVPREVQSQADGPRPLANFVCFIALSPACLSIPNSSSKPQGVSVTWMPLTGLPWASVNRMDH